MLLKVKGINTSKLILRQIKCYASNFKSITELLLWCNSKQQVYREHKSHSAVGTDLFYIDTFIT